MLERLQKIISAAGVTSRRAAEELISEGRVRVNGQVVTELGTKADADKDHIKVDGKLINPKQPLTYVMLNKPAGYVTTMSDPEGRPTVQDLLKGIKVRVYPVGRLDYGTEGMLILTNDGDFAHLVTHPKHELPKTYLAKIKGVLDDKQIESLENGVYLDDGKTAPARLKKIRKEEANSWVEITITEGRKRQVRRMFDRVGRSVIRLKRVRTGALVLGDLQEGKFRHMTNEEVSGLRELAQRTDIKGLKSATGSRKSDVDSQQSGVGSQKAEVRQREVEDKEDGSFIREVKPKPAARVPKRGLMADLSRDQVRVPVSQEEMQRVRKEKRDAALKGPKPAHRGPTPDLRPWRLAETKSEDRRDTGTRGFRPERTGPGPDYKRPRPAARGYVKPSERGPRMERPAQGTEFKRPRPASGGYAKPADRGTRTERPQGADYKRPRPSSGGYAKPGYRDQRPETRPQGAENRRPRTASGSDYKKPRPAFGGFVKAADRSPGAERDYKRPRPSSGGFAKPSDRGPRTERPQGADYKRPRPSSGGYAKPGYRDQRTESRPQGSDFKRPRPASGGYAKPGTSARKPGTGPRKNVRPGSSGPGRGPGARPKFTGNRPNRRG